MTDPSVRPGRGRLQVLFIAALFFVPAVGAWMLMLSGWRPAGTTNVGVLVQPPQQVAAEGWRWRSGEALASEWFTGHWTVLAVRDSACGDACQEDLDGILRVRILLGGDAQRVRPLLLQPDGVSPPANAPPALRLATAPSAAVERLMGAALPGAVEPGETAYYVIDYLGFRMMAYPQPLQASGLLEDLERLLKLANEDVERLQRCRKREASSG